MGDTTGHIARLQANRGNGPRFDLDVNGNFVNANLLVEAGSYLTFEVVSTSNSGCDEIYLGGVLDGTLMTGVGATRICRTTAPVTVGPVPEDGYYTITTKKSRFFADFGEPGGHKLTPLPGGYLLEIEDWSDADYNDIVLRVKVVRPTVELDCNGKVGSEISVSVTRGDSLACRVQRVGGQGPVTVRGWSFNAKPRADGGADSAQWAGVMVKGGTMRVDATADGDTGRIATATATIVMVDRVWSGKSPAIQAETVRNGSDPDPLMALPARVEFAHDLGHVHFRAAKDHTKAYPADPTAEVRGGPNDGWFYYTDLTFPVYAPIVLNDDALARGSEFYLSQVERARGNALNFGTNYCPREYVTGALRADAQRHEEKHVEVFQTVRSAALADSIRVWEARVDSLGDADMVDAYRREYDRTVRLARDESERVVDAKNGPYVVRFAWQGRPCTLKNVFGADLANKDEN